MEASGCGPSPMHFVWRVPTTQKEGEVFNQSQGVIENLRPQFPVFHTHAMRTAMFTKFGRIAPTAKSSTLRYFYRDLTGDASSSNDCGEAEIDERVMQLQPDDPMVIIDLREVKHPERRTKYDVFWNEAEKFLNEDIGTAVDDRRHGQIAHLAKAISIRDFREQVQ